MNAERDPLTHAEIVALVRADDGFTAITVFGLSLLQRLTIAIEALNEPIPREIIAEALGGIDSRTGTADDQGKFAILECERRPFEKHCDECGEVAIGACIKGLPPHATRQPARKPMADVLHDAQGFKFKPGTDELDKAMDQLDKAIEGRVSSDELDELQIARDTRSNARDNIIEPAPSGRAARTIGDFSASHTVTPDGDFVDVLSANKSR